VTCDQLFGRKFDKIVQHATAQGDLAYAIRCSSRSVSLNGSRRCAFLSFSLGLLMLMSVVGEK
jgi:hypothetical protein